MKIIKKKKEESHLYNYIFSINFSFKFFEIKVYYIIIWKKEIPHNRDITYFAKTNFRNSDNIFGIKRKDRRQHMYLLGKSGTGKSVLMSNLIVQNIKMEGVCVVDPHGELVEEILHLIPEHRTKDVIYFNPADTDFHIGFNVIQLDDPKYKHLVASGLMGIFTKIGLMLGVLVWNTF